MSQTKPTSLSFSPQMAGSSNVLQSPFMRIQDLGYLYALNTNVSSFVLVKLSGSGNYLIWKAQMICLLDSKNMRGIVDATFVGPIDYGTGITRRYDSLVKGWIFGSVIEDVLVEVFNLGSAKAVWEKLKSIYDPTVSLQLVGHIKIHMRFPDNLWDEIDKLDYSDTYRPCYTRPQSYCQRFLKVEQSMKNTAESCSITAALITAIVFAIGITVSTQDVNNKEMWTPLFEKRIAMIILFISDAISLFASGTALLVFLSILTSCFAEKDFLLSLPRRMFIGLLSLLLSTTTMMVAFTTTLFLVFCDEKLWMLALICGLAFIPIVFIVGIQLPHVVDLFTSTYLHILGKQRKNHVLRDFKSSKNLHEAFIKVHWSEVESMLKKVQGVASKLINSDGCNVLRLATEIGKEMRRSINSILTSSALIQDTEYLYASTTNVSSFVSVKLSGSNNNINKCDIVDSTLVRGRTFGSVTENVPAEVFNISSAKADWEKLKSICDPTPAMCLGGSNSKAKVIFLGRHSHPNLVKLLGYCYGDDELLRVYEFMQRGILENHLFGRVLTIQPLPWDIRIKIAIGAAQGLEFLHTSDQKVIYRDFKAPNILLDGSYNSNLSDFGLAKLASASQSHVTARVMGTYGYIAPEYMTTGHLYVKSDVYGFGIVLVEMLTGLRALDKDRPANQRNLVEWSEVESILQEEEELGKEQRQWLTEVDFLGKIEHPNLVKLIGYCFEEDMLESNRVMVYEYMSNRSLDYQSNTPLSWLVRLNMARDAAVVLTYLHQEMRSNSQIIFGDFKSSNVLLDENWNAKLSECGFIREGPQGGWSHVLTLELKKFVEPTYITTKPCNITTAPITRTCKKRF